ncbi:hypothetical protein [Rhizobium sp. CCGE 510]|uniref:hypothetical protein n=1 Tax=Rhizobium sp. CCGE 510 TaxID=1132836 RepID=UPI0002D93EDE|nr:hypothetical protein [Rhizobium sp. CCGE 510]
MSGIKNFTIIADLRQMPVILGERFGDVIPKHRHCTQTVRRAALVGEACCDPHEDRYAVVQALLRVSLALFARSRGIIKVLRLARQY